MPSLVSNSIRLSVPHNGDPALPKRLMSSEFRSAIFEVYFSGNPLSIPSGRRPKIKHHIRLENSGPSFDEHAYDRDLYDLIEYFSSRSIRCNLLLNFDGSLTPTMLAYVHDLVSAGVTAVTAGSVSILTQIFDRYGPSVRIQNSVYIPVHDLAGISKLLDIGVSTLLIAPDFNHDREFLCKVSNLLSSRGCELKIMVNEGCVKHCPHRMDDLRDAQSYPVQDAVNDYIQNQDEILRLSNPCRGYLQRKGILRTNYVHPNDLGAYLDLEPLIKIVGRSFPSELIFNTCQAYYRGHYDGDLRKLVENFKHATEAVVHGPHGRAVFN